MIIKKEKNIFIISFFLSLGLFIYSPVYGYVMSSTNYRLQNDSINIAGGNSTSTSYILEDTAGEVGSGISSSTSYIINAGYQQSSQISISISSPGNLDLSSSINGLTGGTATGSLGWNVSTNDNAGYTLYIKASTTPAMLCTGGGCSVGSDSFADYTPSTSTPDFSWGIINSASEFGFSPEGNDLVSKYKDNTLICGTGSSDTTDKCWNGLSTTNDQISGSASANLPNGVTTTVKFQAESGSTHIQPSGTYQTTITVTGIAN